MRVVVFRLFALGLVSLVAATACGGGDDDGGNGEPMGLDAYYAGLNTILDEFQSSSDASFNTLTSSDDLDELKDAFAALPESLSLFLEYLDDLSPPEEAADLQQDAETAGDALLLKMEEVNDEVQETENIEDFFATAGNDDLEALNDEFNASCPPLQQVADDNAIDVDLACPN